MAYASLTDGLDTLIRDMLERGLVRAAWAGFPLLHRNPARHRSLSPIGCEFFTNQLGIPLRLSLEHLREIHPMAGNKFVRYVRWRLYRTIKGLLGPLDPSCVVIESIKVTTLINVGATTGGEDCLASLVKVKLIALD